MEWSGAEVAILLDIFHIIFDCKTFFDLYQWTGVEEMDLFSMAKFRRDAIISVKTVKTVCMMMTLCPKLSLNLSIVFGNFRAVIVRT